MSSRSSQTKPEALYAAKRREARRIEREDALRQDVEQQLTQYFQENDFLHQQHPESFYPAVYEIIKRKATNLVWKKYAHEFFRAYVNKINQTRDEPLPLPILTFDMVRDQPVFTFSWFENGHHIDEIIEKLWDYWILTKDSTAFTDNEIVGNILISAILFSGLNHKASLTALLEHLIAPKDIRAIGSMNIIFLEPLSSTYGDLYIDEKTIRKSRHFVPDQITRLWLIHFNTRQIQYIDLNIEDYLKLIFNKLQISFTNQSYKFLRDNANFNWMQLPNADIDPALGQCLIENIETCGLSETEFQKFIQPQFKIKDDHHKDHHDDQNIDHRPQGKNSTLSNLGQAVNAVIKIHKDMLNLIRKSKTSANIPQLMIDYCLEHADQFNEFSKRMVLWLISLYQPQMEKVKQLAACFNFTADQFEKSFKHDQPLKESSIYTYYTRIAEPWLSHSLQFLEADDDMNTIVNNIYRHIITNTRLADEAQQPEFKSKGQTLRMLKRFHRFQQKVFQADAFELESISVQNRPRARIIAPQTYQACLQKLDILYKEQSIEEYHYQNLKMIYSLAYRTGMRINEILSLRLNDIEGLRDLSIWVRPYGSKKQGNLHQLKTDSAERIIPAYCLLKAEEYQLFHRYVVEQRLSRQVKSYLFHSWNDDSKLNKHSVTTPFKKIMNDLFTQHDYSFHSFRHTAANHLALLLNCEYEPLVQQLTDYTEAEYTLIRKELLRSPQGQNHWFVIAHLLGHIDPSETFKSYIHLSYLIAGHRLLKYHPDIENHLAKKLMGYHRDFAFLKQAKDTRKFNFNRHATQLSQLLLHDQTSWAQTNASQIMRDGLVQTAPHDYRDYFAGTTESKITVDYFYKCLTLLDAYQNPQQVADEMCLPHELVQQWYDNAKILSAITSNKHIPRLIDRKAKYSLIPTKIDTAEDIQACRYFFDKIQSIFINNPDQIRAVLQTFLNRATLSHTGIQYASNKIDQLELFYAQSQGLFPQQFWQIRGQALDNVLDARKQPLLHALARSNPSPHDSTLQHIRLQLFSNKNNKALAAFKFCLHLACIGRPNGLTLQI